MLWHTIKYDAEFYLLVSCLRIRILKYTKPCFCLLLYETWPVSLREKPPVLNHSNPFHSVLPCFFRVNCNIILQCKTRSSKWPLSFRSPHQNSVSTSPVSYTCHTPQPSNSLLIWSLEYLVRSTDNRAPRYVVFSTLLLPRPFFESKYLSQHPIYEHPQRKFPQYIHIYIYRVIKNECLCFNNLSYTIHFR